MGWCGALGGFEPPTPRTDSQITSIFAAARPLAVQDRDPFLQEVASLLAGVADPGDGDVARAVRAVQRKHFDPPDERDEGACFANRQAPISRRETGAPETSR
jgi:hypothetical protein